MASYHAPSFEFSIELGLYCTIQLGFGNTLTMILAVAMAFAVFANVLSIVYFEYYPIRKTSSSHMVTPYHAP